MQMIVHHMTQFESLKGIPNFTNFLAIYHQPLTCTCIFVKQHCSIYDEWLIREECQTLFVH